MTRRRRLVAGAAGIIAVVALLSALTGGGHAVKPHLRLALAHPRSAGSAGAGPLSLWSLTQLGAARSTPACQPTSGPSDYVNPLARARVRPERIDQGVDYAGSGTLVAIGAATLTYAATTDTGWPGSFIEYRLLDGPDANCYVYYAEGVNPTAGLRVGERIASGQPIATIIQGWPTGVEVGWGAGVSTATYAAETHQWSAASDQESRASAAGRTFSTLIASLGGPPGRVEG